MRFTENDRIAAGLPVALIDNVAPLITAPFTHPRTARVLR